MITGVKNLLNTLYQLIRFFYLIIRLKAFRPTIKNIPRTDKVKCLLIGNGPSLDAGIEELLLNFNEHDIFVVNSFASSPLYLKIRPKYYVFADPLFWEITENPVSLKTRDILFQIREHTNWNLIILIPLPGVKAFTLFFKGCDYISIFHYNDIIVETNTRVDYFLYSRSIACPWIQNVMVQAIYLAINLSYKEIDLLGVDHGWTKELAVNDQNEVCLKDPHFYDTDADIRLMPWLQLDGKPYKMHKILQVLARSFYGYHILEKYSVYMGAKIFNLTQNSFIDSFERKIL